MDPIAGQLSIEMYGWPLPVTPTFSIHYDNDVMTGYSASKGDWKLAIYVIDMFVNLAFLMSAVFLAERRIRRREHTPENAE